MMNIPKYIESFGSLQLLWEGGYCGESILSAIKPTISKVSKNVLENTAVTCMAKKSMTSKIKLHGITLYVGFGPVILFRTILF